MKKFFSFTFVAALLLTLVSLPGAPTTKAQAGLVSSIYSRMQRNQQSLKTLGADISMEKYNAQLRDSDKFFGTVKYIPVGGRSAFVRLEWSKPQHEILVVANGAYILYRPRLNMAYVGTTNSIHSQKDGDVLALMNMSAGQLRTRFSEPQDVREETLWGGVWTQHMRVTPKGAASYKYIEVWIDKEGMPVQTKMVEKNDDATTVRLTNVAKNQTIPMDLFNLKLDSSVKRVKG
jgi:outer membrane lipoprotein-sorting protein